MLVLTIQTIACEVFRDTPLRSGRFVYLLLLILPGFDRATRLFVVKGAAHEPLGSLPPEV
jgi:hypothetical protein